jgi:deazaflavin-dependent oxidoreductase (nitroreductase family)
MAGSTRATRDWAGINRPVIERFRQAGRRTAEGTHPLLLLTTRGVRSGRERVTPLNFSRDGDRYIVMASKGGSSTHPDWYHNLAAHPTVTVEADGEQFTARAKVSDGPERQRLLKIHTTAMPFFGAYERRVKKREIPVIALERDPATPDRKRKT